MFIIGLLLCVCVPWSLSTLNGDNPKYSNLWIAKIKGGEEVAQRIARDLGYNYQGKCGDFEDYYELIKEDHPEVSLRDSDHLTTSLLDMDEVEWATQEKLVRLDIHLLNEYTYEAEIKRAILFLKEEARKQNEYNLNCKSVFSCITNYPESIFYFLGGNGNWDFSKLGTFPTTPAPKGQLKTYSQYVTKAIGLTTRKLSAYILDHGDPFWIKQWNMQDYRTEDMPVMDLNVVPVHKMGITGKGVTVAVVDNGVEHNNFDFSKNFDIHLSYDMCKRITGSQPSKGHSHGTNCAGVIAMTPDNDLCGVGIAYDVKIVGIRALCKWEQCFSLAAKALRHRISEIDIYSNSFGNALDGIHINSRDRLTHQAYYDGVTKGRNGKGVIYVRSAGNDKDVGDNCAADSDLASPYVIIIGGADQFGETVSYSERCTGIMATTYTQGYSNTEGIVAPNVGGGCRSDFRGTSAAVPQASGIIALVLQANPELTYRDVMHLITMSAEVAPLANNKDTWYKNGRGFWVSNDFGFGLMNAENMVNLAKIWENVPTMSKCVIASKISEPIKFNYLSDANIRIETTACEGGRDEVNYLEHIELNSVVKYPRRGAITVFIRSPAGTSSQLLESRYNDKSSSGLNGLGIISTHNWGENPRGTWVVTYNISRDADKAYEGKVRKFTLTLYGTKTEPAHYNKKREYAAFRLPNGLTN